MAELFFSVPPIVSGGDLGVDFGAIVSVIVSPTVGFFDLVDRIT